MDNKKYQTLIKSVDWTSCDKKYFDSLTYIDLFDNLTFIQKNRVIGKQTKELNSCNVGYFLGGQLLRIEIIEKDIPQENTFLIWENGRLIKTYLFNLGYFFGRPVNDGIQLRDSWTYEYSNNELISLRWITYKSKRYNVANDLYIDYKYDYDDSGLKFIYKSITTDNNSNILDCILFDREKEKFLKTSTIIRTPLTERKSKESDNVIDFALKQSKVAYCQSCGQQMTYILSINLNDKRFNRNKINLDSIPVLHCFDCLESQSYKPATLAETPITNSSFTEQKFVFKRETNEEKEKNSLLKIGGQPNWIQNAEHPTCECCNSPMKFIAEINTDENLTNGNAVLAFGDSGKLYVFACCDNVSCIPQWY